MKRKFVKVMFFGALALSTVTYVGCKDYDDDIDNLQTQIDANKASIADLQAKVNDGKWVKDVVKIEGGFKITFNNGDAYDIVNGKNGVTHKVEIKEGYWYIDNVKQIAATGPQGPVGPVGPAGPDGPKALRVLMANHPMLELMAFGISINLSTRMLLKKEIKLDGYKVLLQKLVFI